MSRSLSRLSRRERQIMEIVYQKGQATVADILQAIPDDLSYSSIRTQMTILERKGFLKHKKNGRAYVYSPTVNHRMASRLALKQVINTFYSGSVENVVAALVTLKSANLSPDEYNRLSELIKSMRKEDNKK
ncbi:MAG: BlaI/MecI/CopY family transcriptional regulator [Candidatus Zixiibacteriota bacterium]